MPRHAQHVGDSSSAWGVVHRLLERTLGHSQAAALLSSGLSVFRSQPLPTTPAGVLTFVREYVVPAVAEAHGDAFAAALAESCSAELEAEAPAVGTFPTIPAPPPQRSPSRGSGPRQRVISVTGEAGRPVAVLAGGEAVERASLARALVTAGFDVRTTLGELQAADDFRLAVVDLDRSDDQEAELLRGLLAARPSVRVIARCADGLRAERAAAQAGLADAQVVSKQVSLAALVVRARELAGL